MFDLALFDHIELKKVFFIASLEIHPKTSWDLFDIRKYLAFMYKPWLILNSIYCQLCIWNHDKDLMSLNGHEKANEPENESFAYLWCYVQLVHIPATAKARHSPVVNFLLIFQPLLILWIEVSYLKMKKEQLISKEFCKLDWKKYFFSHLYRLLWWQCVVVITITCMTWSTFIIQITYLFHFCLE